MALRNSEGRTSEGVQRGQDKRAMVQTSTPFKVEEVPLSVWLNPVVWILCLIDFILSLICWPYHLYKNLIQESVHSVPNDDGGFRHAKPLTSPDGQCKTCYDCYQLMYKKWGACRCQGVRTFLGEIGTKKVFGETVWNTYDDVRKIADNIGAGLVALGCVPDSTNILVFESTCAEWSQLMQGCFTQSITLATAYDTLGIEAVEHSIRETDSKVVVCNYKDAQKVVDMAKTCPNLTHVVYTYHYVDPETKRRQPNPINDEHENITVMSFDQLIAIGVRNPCYHSKPREHSNAIIMYTSGSTGQPKGVRLTHANLTAGVAGLASHDKTKTCCTYVNYLPMAHILAMVLEVSCFWYGWEIGYADPKTISSKGAIRQRPDGTLNDSPEYPYPPGAIQEFRPHLMVGVPRVWDIFKKGIEEKVAEGSTMKQAIFLAAYASRKFALKTYRDTPLFNLLVFKKITDTIGGNASFGFTGGGPLAADVHEFVRVCLNINLMQGYGLTETASCGTIQAQSDHRCLMIGQPTAATALKVESCQDICDEEGKPYLASDRMHHGDPCLGRGEILVKGPCVAAGYYKRPEETAKAFLQDGWFRTGDIGVFYADKCLKIVDRVKNLVKLKGGEYIPLEAMEREYMTSSYVDGLSGGVMAYGDGDMNRPVLFVQANVRVFKSQGDTRSVEELCECKDVKATVLADMQRIGKARLPRNALITAVHLIPGCEVPGLMWTPQNGCLTASGKLQRSVVKRMFKQQIDAMKQNVIL